MARGNLKASQLTIKRDYDLKVVEHQYNVGDLVYQLDTATIKGKCRKLSPVWKGPGRVVEKLTPFLYRVQMKKSMFTANHDRLKLCRDRDVPSWAVHLREKLKRRGQHSDLHLSKALTFILRHGAETQGYKVMPGGFLHVEEILQSKRI